MGPWEESALIMLIHKEHKVPIWRYVRSTQ